MRVLLLTNIPSPYMVGYVNELGQKCELTVLFERRSASDRDASWDRHQFTNFNAHFLRGIHVGCEKALSIEQLKYLKKGKYDHIIVGDPLTPTGIVSILYLALRGIPFCIQSEGGFQGTGVGLKERFKMFIVSKAAFYLSGMGDGPDDYFSLYGGNNPKIYSYPFSSMYRRDIRKSMLDAEEKLDLRKKLGITEERVIVSVGQFIPRKGMDILMQACRDFDETIGVYIIGGNPPDDYACLARECHIKGIHFVAFQPFDRILDYLACCDVFALATREDTWGLVINEAMSQGAPVITTTRCIAGKKLVRNGENGYLVESEDVENLCKRILEIINNPEMQRHMAQNAIEMIQPYCYENMAEKIYLALKNECGNHV